MCCEGTQEFCCIRMMKAKFASGGYYFFLGSLYNSRSSSPSHSPPMGQHPSLETIIVRLAPCCFGGVPCEVLNTCCCSRVPATAQAERLSCSKCCFSSPPSIITHALSGRHAAQTQQRLLLNGAFDTSLGKYYTLSYLPVGSRQ